MTDTESVQALRDRLTGLLADWGSELALVLKELDEKRARVAELEGSAANRRDELKVLQDRIDVQPGRSAGVTLACPIDCRFQVVGIRRCADTGLDAAQIAAPLAEAGRRGWLECTGGLVRPTALGKRFLNDVIALFLP